MANANRSNSYQPVQAGGLLGLFGRLFVSTPAYRGEGQPQPQPGPGVLGRLFGGAQPVYQTGSASPSGPDATSNDVDEVDPSDPSTDSVPGVQPGCDGMPLTIVIARD